MKTAIYLTVTLTALAAVYLLCRLTAGLYSYFRYRGKRIVTCPETKRPAAVELDAAYLAFGSVLGSRHFRLRGCSRWAERDRCGQPCLKQIEKAPLDCLVRTLVTSWYAKKSCVYCGKPIPPIDWLQHKPALIDPRGRTVQWNDVPAEKLPDVFTTFQPVCWNCHIAETFRREHPELVVDRSIHS